jgi:hypothetical protein
MQKSNSFWDHPIATIEEALSIRKQIEGLQKKLTGLLNDTSTAIASVIKGKRKMSASARAKIGAAQKARWAKSKASAPVAKPVVAKAAPAPKKKGGLTPEGRARLAAAMKARWAARKKGAPALNAAKKK